MSQFPVSKSREPIVAWREWAFLYPNYLLDRGKYQAWEPRVRYEMPTDRKSTRLNSSHGYISYAVFCLKKKNHTPPTQPVGPTSPVRHPLTRMRIPSYISRLASNNELPTRERVSYTRHTRVPSSTQNTL